MIEAERIIPAAPGCRRANAHIAVTFFLQRDDERGARRPGARYDDERRDRYAARARPLAPAAQKTFRRFDMFHSDVALEAKIHPRARKTSSVNVFGKSKTLFRMAVGAISRVHNSSDRIAHVPPASRGTNFELF